MRSRLALLLCCLVLGFLPPVSSARAASPAPRDSAPVLPALPADFQQVDELTCPSATLCLATAFPNDAAIAVGTGDRTTWTVTTVPHPAGEYTFVSDVECVSPSFCYAWGIAGAPTVWFSTDPASGVWQRQVVGPYPSISDIGQMTCPSTTLCVVTTAPDQNGTDPGQAWVTQDPLGGSWSPSPLDAIYRPGNIDCAGFMCVLAGQSKDLSVNASLWTTSDVRAGGWTRVEPTSPSGGVDGVRRVRCVSASLCVVNALVTSGGGGTVFLHMGYFASTAPTTGAWDWHEVEADAYALVGPLYCQTAGECLVYGFAGLGSDPDPTDGTPPVALFQGQYGLNLKGLTCFDASTCQVWGSDSGAASAGPLYSSRVWRGSPSGGAWSNHVLPVPAGHTGEVPEAATLACANAGSCTAVGVLTNPDYPYDVTDGPIVWTAGPDGVWHVVAEGYADGGGGGGGGGSVTKVSTKVSIGVKRTVVPHRLKGRVSAQHGCQKARRVKVIGKLGVPAVTVKSARDGRWSVGLTRAVRRMLAPRVRVKVAEKTRAGGTIRCLAATSSKIRW